MRVLLLNFEYPPIGGGAGYATQSILNEFKDKEIEIDVITSAWREKTNEVKLNKNIRIIRLDIGKKTNIHYWQPWRVLRYSIQGFLRMNRLLKEKKYDVIHAFFTYPCGAMAVFQKKVPVVVSIRGFDVPGFNRRLNWLDYVNKFFIRMIWKKSAAVVANSSGLRKLAQKTAPKQKIKIIHNGINTKEFFPKEGNNKTTVGGTSIQNLESFSSVRPLRILCVSRLISRKGIENLILAIGGLNAENVELTIVGEGDQEQYLKKLADGQKVTFNGFVRHDLLIKYYQEHDLFVLPSENEGMPNTVLEAMACGLPIIMKNTGGAIELIINEINGYVLPNNYPKTLMKYIQLFLNNPKMIFSMGLESRKRAEELGWDRIAAQYIACYRDIAKSPA